MSQTPLLNRSFLDPTGQEKTTRVNRDATAIGPRKSNGQLIAGHLTPEDAREHLSLLRAAEAGNADAQLILKLMNVQEQFKQSPALVAQVQASIDMLKARMADPA